MIVVMMSQSRNNHGYNFHTSICAVVVVLLSALRAQVTAREKVGSSGWVRFAVNVATVYKRPSDWPSRFQPDVVWVAADDLACRCPKLRRRRSYLLVGQTSVDVPSPSGGGGGRTLPGLVVGRDSVAVRWRDAWSRRMKRFARSRRC